MLGPVLGSPVQQQHGFTGVSTEKSHKDDESIGSPVIGGKAESSTVSGISLNTNHSIAAMERFLRFLMSD